MTIFSKYGLLWFGVRLVQGLDNEPMRQIFKEAHEVIGVVLLVMIALHVVAAIKHQVIDKDNLLKRMSLR
jgi:cytochrome b561